MKPAGQSLVRDKRSPGPFAIRSKSRTSRQTRHAPQVRSPALKLVSIAVTTLASWISRMLAGRLSQAWNPERDTARISQSQLTGQMWRCLAMKANLISPRARKKRSPLRSDQWRAWLTYLQDVTLRPEPGDLFLQSRNLGQIGPHPPVPGKRNRRRGCQLSHPPPQHALRHIEVARGLCNSDTPIRHKPHGLDLELTTELPSRHIHSPVPWSRSYLRVLKTGRRSERPVAGQYGRGPRSSRFSAILRMGSKIPIVTEKSACTPPRPPL